MKIYVVGSGGAQGKMKDKVKFILSQKLMVFKKKSPPFPP